MESRLISLLGLMGMLLIAWAGSLNRKRFPWRTVLCGLALQLMFAVVILKTAFGRTVFQLAQTAATRLIGFANDGTSMLFGPLAQADVLGKTYGPGNRLVLAITVIATITLVSALPASLNHWGILQWVVRSAAWAMERTMRTRGSESLSAAANILMGQTGAPLVIKRYLARLTQSEILAVMIGGMATIAGGVLAVYVQFGEQTGRTDMAGHLLTWPASQRACPTPFLASAHALEV